MKSPRFIFTFIFLSLFFISSCLKIKEKESSLGTKGWCATVSTALTDSPYANSSLGADGSASKPFKICTGAQLNNIPTTSCGSGVSVGCSHNFILEADVNLSPYNFSMIGSGANQYNGFFNGQGYSIHNLYINNASTPSAFIHTMNTSGVIEQVRFVAPDVTGTQFVATAVGDNFGTVRRVHVENGRLTSSSSGVGGIVGRLPSGGGPKQVIESGGDVDVYSNGQDSGGLVGFMNDGLIDNCYAEGIVTNVGAVSNGGLVGYMSGGIIRRSWASPKLVGGGKGGLIGTHAGSSAIEDNFFDKTTVGTAEAYSGSGGDVVGITGRGTAEFNIIEIFETAGWDMITVWKINKGRPRFRWNLR